jgi:outer membrane lipoprotein-sorting protein
MKIKIVTLALFIGFCNLAQAQTADEIIEKFFENTGGRAKYAALQGLKMTGKLNQQGMEFPIEIVQLKDGRQYFSAVFQGKEIKQGVYDGTNLWSINFMTMKAEKSDAESTENFKTSLGDFPDAFFNYKTNGYKAEFLGKETVEGTETYKIRLTKKPILVDGKKEDNVVFYYFDAEDFVPIMTETEIKSGQAKGKVQQIKMSDYQEVDGLLFPFTLSQGLKGEGSQPITLTKIELNPKVENSVFEMPKE